MLESKLSMVEVMLEGVNAKRRRRRHVRMARVSILRRLILGDGVSVPFGGR